MRENQTSVKAPPFVDIQRSHLGEYAHFSRFHTALEVIAFECDNGCETPYGTPERWVLPLGQSEDDEMSGMVRGGVLGRVPLCPTCGSYKVKMLMVYPTTPREKRYWFWDMSTYENSYEARHKANRAFEARPQAKGEGMA